MCVHSVRADSLRSDGMLPPGLLCPWDSLGKNTGEGCHFLLQGIFPTQGSSAHPLWVSPALAGEFFTIVPHGKPVYMYCFPPLFKNVYLFIFGCAGSLLLHRIFSSCGERGLLSSCSAQASPCCRFSCYRAQVLGHMGSVAEASGL